MDRLNTEVFSPIRNIDDVITKRRTDSFSKFLKGPEVFKKEPKLSGNVDKNTPVEKNSNKKLNKTHQKKPAKSETLKADKDSISPVSISSSVFGTSSEESSSLNKENSKALHLTSKKKKDAAINFITKRNDKLKSNEQDEVESTRGKFSSHSGKKSSVDLLKNSLQSGAAFVSESSKSKETEKVDKPTSLSQRNPLSQIQSGVFEKLIKDAVDSRFDEIQQTLSLQNFQLQKILFTDLEKMEQRHKSDQETLYKIIEALVEENRTLRNAILASR